MTPKRREAINLSCFFIINYSKDKLETNKEIESRLSYIVLMYYT